MGTAFDPAAGSTAAGKTALVTGANTGIGLETAVALAARGAHTILLCRDRARGEAALAAVRGRTGSSRVELLLADLASLASVRAGAKELLERHERLDVLVNNAGVWTGQRRTSPDGHELTFAVNHLGPFLLTSLLEPALAKGAPARVVNVSSTLHTSGRIDWDDLQLTRGWGAQKAYAQSKLLNVLFTRELARRLAPRRVTANAVHPGVVATDLARDFPWLVRKAIGIFFLSPSQGAEAQVWLATDPALDGKTGCYFHRKKETEASPAARDDEAARRLFRLSAELVGVPL